MATYTLRQLRYFVCTVEAGSIAEASRQLFIAQPSISSAIKGLEESFNMQLFIRHHAQGVSLTPAGSRFYQQARGLLHTAREFEQNQLAESAGSAGQVNIGCYESMAPLYVPRLLAGFHQRYPNMQVQMRDGEQQELLEGLNTGTWDLVLLWDHQLDDSVATEHLMPPKRPYALFHESHPLAGAPEVSLSELCGEPMILLDVKPSNAYFLSLFTRHGLTPNVVFRSPSLEMVRGMVGQGAGFSLLVTRPWSSYTYDGQRLVMVELAGEVEPSGLVAAWLQCSPLTRPAQLFISHCREHLWYR